MTHQLLLQQDQSPPSADTKLERKRVWYFIKDGNWWTLYEIQRHIHHSFGVLYSDSSLSARVRDFRKPKFGGYTIERRKIPNRRSYEYRLRMP